jgi:hypothetical protein
MCVCQFLVYAYVCQLLVYVYVCLPDIGVCACVRVCVCQLLVCVRVCVCQLLVCVHACVCVSVISVCVLAPCPSALVRASHASQLKEYCHLLANQYL